MKKRQRNKILKRSGTKLHSKQGLTALEKVVCSKSAESKLCIAMFEFHVKEYDAGTIYKEGYIDRLTKVVQKVGTIENITGVKK
ncbi:hypothetical protein OXB_2998 [Bacillus sp. OxB-1]|uniref:hypothetical protein n=1 Tax=Bacillus sp. (strain OxB-1) TaxID=98228 RepID=UPI000581D75B|nr:hypothetical protein [Bacillus sp. OxB-1]BAQ11468.1 hypothetical protein OXB_2998 [Bacillus sp. OxB-1]